MPQPHKYNRIQYQGLYRAAIAFAQDEDSGFSNECAVAFADSYCRAIWEGEHPSLAGHLKVFLDNWDGTPPRRTIFGPKMF